MRGVRSSQIFWRVCCEVSGPGIQQEVSAEAQVQRHKCRGTSAKAHVQRHMCKGTSAKAQVQRHKCRGKLLRIQPARMRCASPCTASASMGACEMGLSSGECLLSNSRAQQFAIAFRKANMDFTELCISLGRLGRRGRTTRKVLSAPRRGAVCPLRLQGSLERRSPEATPAGS